MHEIWITIFIIGITSCATLFLTGHVTQEHTPHGWWSIALIKEQEQETPKELRIVNATHTTRFTVTFSRDGHVISTPITMTVAADSTPYIAALPFPQYDIAHKTIVTVTRETTDKNDVHTLSY